MNKLKTNRGFSYIERKDLYNQQYSIQKSSLADEDAIWFGIDEVHPKILASKAEHYGMITEETTGWIPYPVSKDVLINTRMHLNRKQVEELLPILKKFVETGDI